MVRKILLCLIYLAAVGLCSFFVGRFIAVTCTFQPDRFPYRCCKKEEQFYHFLKINKWQNKLPDMSKIVPKLIPAKKLCFDIHNDIPRMVQETCVAELIHFCLCLLGFVCVWIMPGPGGWIFGIAYCIVNLPFLMVQRYNRPRLQELMQRLAHYSKPGEVLCAS